MNENDVREFIIIPPITRRDEIVRSKERLENYLSRRFPEYMFRVSPFVPLGDEEAFNVLPIMNFLGDDGKSYMCAEPKRWIMHDIAQACAEFDTAGRRDCAA